jgi:uncharacterized membrane-anchored protein YjiN (DUF445 family)
MLGERRQFYAMPSPTPSPHRIRRLATGLLVAMTFVFVAASAWQGAHPALGYVRAFAEAAMIGALADWFAVVALFRHPLGVPIPHTAVIPRNKDRIGDGLARFVQEHFLAPEVVGERLAAADVAGALARWMAAEGEAERIAERVSRFLPTLLDTLDDADVRRLVQRAVANRLDKLALAPFAADVLEMLASGQRHQQLVDLVTRKAATLLEQYEPHIRDKVAENTAWLWKMLRVDARVSDKLIDIGRKTLAEVADDPDHALRARVETMLAEFIRDLRESPTYLETGERMKQLLLEHPSVGQYLSDLWHDIRTDMTADVKRPDSRIRAQLAELAQNIGEAVLADDAVRRKLNLLFRAASMEIVKSQRAEIGRLISDTIRRWDSATFSARIEAAVGSDLQYIRINGTLIGGLAGLGIYTASRWLAG